MTKVVRRFYRVGGGNRVAGFLLAIATSILLFLGTGPIAYIRRYLSSGSDPGFISAL